MPLKANLSEDRLRSLDPGNMLGMTLELPVQIERGLELGHRFVREQNLRVPEEVEWMGLGGSAVAGDLLQAFGFEPPALRLRIRVLRSPRSSDARRLVCSYSGNTVEALQAFTSSKPEQIWFSASSGGRLHALAQAANVPHLMLPGGYPPRAAVGYLLGAMSALFADLYGFTPGDWSPLLSRLDEDARAYRSLSADGNPALTLALQMVDRTPVVYTVDSRTMPALAFRFRAQLAENSKVWSHSAELPELAHNEVESFPHLAQLLPPPLVMLLGGVPLDPPTDDPRPGLGDLLDRFRIRHVTLDPQEMWGRSISRLEAGLRLMLLLDAATVYLAVLRAVNPLEIPTITGLKKPPKETRN